MQLKSWLRKQLGERRYDWIRMIKRVGRNPALALRLGAVAAGYKDSLVNIGRMCGTDKADSLHSFRGRSYLHVYEQYLEPIRQGPIKILEIGVKNGASLRTWKAYFPKADVFGIDIDPRCAGLTEPRISIEIGSQDDEAFLDRCFGPSNKFDVIIDDGSHVNEMTLSTFRRLFPSRLNPGGLYIIEDLRCSYMRLDSDLDVRRTWPGMKYNDQMRTLDNDRSQLESWFLGIIRDMDHLRGDIDFIHFWPMVCVLQKAK